MTTRTEELSPFDAAVAAAMAELGETDLSPVSDEGEVFEAADDQAIVEEVEQAEEPTESATQPEEAEVDEIFADLEDDVEPETTDSFEVDVESLSFELPGVEEPVSFNELRDGYMRQADYTRKTQELAQARKGNEEALRLYDMLRSDPHAVVRKLAIDAGLLAPDGQPVADIELSPLRSEADVEAEVQRRVEQAVKDHPSVLNAQLVQVRQAMEGAFSTIEKKYDTKLGPQSRRKILVEARKAGTPDLELVFNALMAQKQKRATTAQELKAAAPSRSTGRTTDVELSDKPATIEEAFTLAEVSLGARG